MDRAPARPPTASRSSFTKVTSWTPTRRGSGKRAAKSLHELDGVVPYVLSAGQPRLPNGRPAHRPQYVDERLLPGRPASRRTPGSKGRTKPGTSRTASRSSTSGRFLVDPVARVRAAGRRAGLGKRDRQALRKPSGDRRDPRLSLFRRHALRPPRPSRSDCGIPTSTWPITARETSTTARRSGESSSPEQQHPLRPLRPRARRRRRPAHQRASRRDGGSSAAGQLPDGRARRRRVSAADAVLPGRAEGRRSDLLALHWTLQDRRRERISRWATDANQPHDKENDEMKRP